MGYLNQAPREFSKQSAAFRKKHGSLKDLTKGYTMQPKYDGCHLIIRVPNDGPAQALTRTGERVRSVDHIVLQVEQIVGKGCVVFGEAFMFNRPFPEISGMVRQHAPALELMFIAFDVVPVDVYDSGGVDPTPYCERLLKLQDALKTPTVLVTHLLSTMDYPAANAAIFAERLKATGGYDGAILRRSDAGWQAGDSKNGEVIKVKPIHSLDLRCTGGFLGKGKYAGLAGGIRVVYKGVETRVGTGFTDAERATMGSGCFEGAIAEVEFMGFTDAGCLREPRFKRWRLDKTTTD